MKKIIGLFLVVCFMVVSAWGQNSQQGNNQSADQRTLEKDFMAGMQYVNAGRHQEVIAYYKAFAEKLDLNQETQRTYHAYAVQLIGNSLISTGDVIQAQRLYLKEIKSLESINSVEIEPYRLLCDALSVTYNQTHNYQQAYVWGLKAKRAFEIAQDYREPYIRCIFNLALTLSNQNQHVWAKMFIDVAMDHIDRQIKSDSHSTNQVAGNSPSAANSNHPQNSAFADKTQLATIYATASNIYEAANFMPEAINAIKRAISITKENKLKAFYPLNNLGYLYLKNAQYPDAIKYFKEAEIYAATSNELNEVGMNIALAQALMANAKASATAAKYSERLCHLYNHEFLLMTKQERENSRSHYKFYLPMYNFFMTDDPTKTGRIYDNVIQMKGLLLRTYQDIQQKVLSSTDGTVLPLYKQLLLLRGSLNQVADKKEIMVLRDSIETLDRELMTRLQVKPTTTTWEDIRNALGKNEVAIEFANLPNPNKNGNTHMFSSEPRYCALVLKKSYDRPHLIPLCRESQFNAVSDTSYYTSTQLYELFWKPLAQEIGDASVVYFSPDRYMGSVAVEHVPMTNGKYLSQNRKMVRVSSTAEIVREKAENTDTEYVLIGGIDYAMDKRDYVALHKQVNRTRSYGDSGDRGSIDDISVATLDEVSTIGNMLQKKGFDCRLLTHSDANESAFKALSGKNIGVLHIATHGFYWSGHNKVTPIQQQLQVNNEARGEQLGVSLSGLLFAGAKLTMDSEILPDNIEDGILTGAEIENLNFSSVDLVVLSACQTGLGMVDPIEGVYGLQRAFKKAGVKSILMTLWKVDDEATRMFMTEFYRHYLRNKSKHRALRAAQQYLRTYTTEDGEHIYADPYYWAGFVLLDAME